MLVVMLILLVATGLATISLQITQSELRAAGSNRLAVQTQYIAENAMVSTLSYVEQMADSDKFCDFLGLGQQAAPPPRQQMWAYGEPANNSSTVFLARRNQWSTQAAWHADSTVAGAIVLSDIPPLTAPGMVGATGTITDAYGTLGPQSAYRAGDSFMYGAQLVANPTPVADYVVDMYDCFPLPGTGAVGNQVAGTTGSNTQVYCVATARGRAFLPGGLTKSWDMSWASSSTSSTAYTVNRFSSAHDARATFVTGPTFGCVLNP